MLIGLDTEPAQVEPAARMGLRLAVSYITNIQTDATGHRFTHIRRKGLGRRWDAGTLHTSMTPEAFIAKWSETTTKERAAAQEHFIDLCRVLGEKTPHEADPTGEWYAFEKGVEKTGAGRGWAGRLEAGAFRLGV